VVAYQILGASVVVNLVLLSIFGQASFLTAKGCDGPLVGKVCQVLDTVYIGTMLFGTDREYADVAYDPTRLSKDDDVTFVDVSNLEAPLEYPEGYFQIANPDQQFASVDQTAMNNGFIAPGIPSNPTVTTTPDLTNTPQVLPPANPNAVEGTLPTFNDANPTTPRNRRNPRLNRTPNGTTVADANANTNTNSNSNPTVQNSNTPNANATAQQDEPVLDDHGVFINKKPLNDQLNETIKQVDQNKIKLDEPFKVTIAATLALNKDGKTYTLRDAKPVVDPKVKNDPVIEKVVQDWILRIGDSGWLGYLNVVDVNKKLKSRKVIISVEQNQTDFTANIRSELSTENDAKTAASGLSLILTTGAQAGKGDVPLFLGAAKSTNQGNYLIFDFALPKDKVQEMIQHKLDEARASAAKPSSATGFSSSNSTAAK